MNKNKETLIKNVKKKITTFTNASNTSCRNDGRYLNAAQTVNGYNIELSGIDSLEEADIDRLRIMDANMSIILRNLGIQETANIEKANATEA